MKHTAFFGWLLVASTLVAADPAPKAGPFDGLKFRNIGPAAGGRVSRVCGVPGNPLLYFAATAGSLYTFGEGVDGELYVGQGNGTLSRVQ